MRKIFSFSNRLLLANFFYMACFGGIFYIIFTDDSLTNNQTVMGTPLPGIALATLFGFSLGWSLKKSMTRIIERLKEGAEFTQNSGRNLVMASKKLLSHSSEQAFAIQEAVSTLNEINAMVAKSVANAGKSAQESQRSQVSSTAGKKAVDEMMSAIVEISESNGHIMAEVDKGNRRISEIVSVINEIANKTKVINDIVFQTKLLSFNASVEAARAGEHGKGFAVVAEEVGNLARMSGNAAKEIAGMLNISIEKVDFIVDDTKVKVEQLVAVSKDKVKTGISKATECYEILEDVVRSVTDVNLMMAEIAMASTEHAEGVNQITNAMSELDQTTQENMKIATETAQFAEQIHKQSIALKSAIKTLENEIIGSEVQLKTKIQTNVINLSSRISRQGSAEASSYDDRRFKNRL